MVGRVQMREVVFEDKEWLMSSFEGFLRGRVLVLEDPEGAGYRGSQSVLRRFFAPKHGPWGVEAGAEWDRACERFACYAAVGELECNREGGFIVLSSKADRAAAFRWAQDVGKGWKINRNYPRAPTWMGQESSGYLEAFRGHSGDVGWYGFAGDSGCEGGVLVLKFGYKDVKGVLTELVKVGRRLKGMEGEGLGTVMGGREPGSYRTVVGSGGQATVLALGPVVEGGVVDETRMRVALKGFPFAEFVVDRDTLFE